MAKKKKEKKIKARSCISRGFVTLNTLERTNHSLGFNYSHYCNGAFGEGHEGEGKGYFVVLAFISILLHKDWPCTPWFKLSSVCSFLLATGFLEGSTRHISPSNSWLCSAEVTLAVPWARAVLLESPSLGLQSDGETEFCKTRRRK